MDALSVEIIGGIIVVTLTAIIGYLIRMLFFKKDEILPLKAKYSEKMEYKYLNGRWHFYWISYDPSNPSEPLWFKGLQFLTIKKNHVEGTTEHIGHPLGDLHFELHGEIRGGKMLFVDSCIEDETDYASVLIPNLRSSILLIGIWTGLDNLNRPIAAPCVLSKKELNVKDLNRVIKGSIFSLVPIDTYNAYFTKNINRVISQQQNENLKNNRNKK